MVRAKKHHGFTLVEMLLVIALISVIAALSIPLYRSFQTRNDLDLSANGVALLLRHARVLSEGMAGDQPWGVHFETGHAIIFIGPSYAGRYGTDVNYEIPSTFVLGGASEVVFQERTGFVSTPTTITITSPNNETRSISVNAKGIVSTQ